MNKEVEIRQAVLSDLDALAILFDGYRQFYGKASDVFASCAFLRDRFEHGQSVIFLANVNQSLVGFTQLYPSFSSVSMARIFILNDLYVAPEGRRCSAGKALLTAAENHARQFSAARLTLTTNIQNLPAQSLYEACGWQRDQQFHTYHLHLS